MNKNKNERRVNSLIRYVIRRFVVIPFLFILLLILYNSIGLSAVIFIIVCLIISISLSVYYLYKRKSQTRREIKELEEKILCKNLKK